MKGPSLRWANHLGRAYLWFWASLVCNAGRHVFVRIAHAALWVCDRLKEIRWLTFERAEQQQRLARLARLAARGGITNTDEGSP